MRHYSFCMAAVQLKGDGGRKSNTVIFVRRNEGGQIFNWYILIYSVVYSVLKYLFTLLRVFEQSSLIKFTRYHWSKLCVVLHFRKHWIKYSDVQTGAFWNVKQTRKGYVPPTKTFPHKEISTTSHKYLTYERNEKECHLPFSYN